MKRSIIGCVVLSIICALSANAIAQTDEIRQATGLPIPVGSPVIYGRVSIKGLAANERKPIIFVSLVIGGVQSDRRQATDDGYYYFLTSPTTGTSVVFEVNGSEIGRIQLSETASRTVRQDISFDWPSVRNAIGSKPGVISVKDEYARAAEAQKLMDKAIAAAKDKQTDLALDTFKGIVEKDPKDFPAWTEIGTIYFEKKQFDEAERAYLTAIALKPDFMIALMNLGKLYLTQKKSDQAIVTFTKAAIADRNSADAFQYLGESYLMAKQGSKAVIALNEAIRIDPVAMADVHLRLASLYDAAGMKDKAAAEYKMFLERRPKYPEKEKLEAYIKSNSKP
jgi:Tfp pilus assembly protein PilF